MAILRAAARDASLLRQTPNLFQNCLLCGKCEKSCPAHLPLTKIFLQRRLKQAKLSRKSFTEKVKFSFFHNPALDAVKPLLKILGTTQKTSYKKALPFRIKKPAPENIKQAILLFPGCIGKKTRPSLAYAACNALKISGHTVISPSGLRCCGKMPGFHEKSLVSACRANLKLLRQTSFDKLAVICPSCLDMIKNVWPNLEGLTDREKQFCRELAARVHYVGHFFAMPAEPPANPTNAIVWHKSCKLGDEDRLATMSALGFSQGIPSSSTCCGGACPTLDTDRGKKGLLLEENQTAANKLAKICRDKLINSKPATVISECPHCLLALENIFAKRRDKIRVCHAAEYFSSIQKKAANAHGSDGHLQE